MITLPPNFESDIQGQNLNLFPLVTIGNFGGVERFVSTKDVTVDDRHFKPLLLNIPSIKESMDFENRNYKISNVTLKISNFEYEGERFSDVVDANGVPLNLINKEVRIFWKSQSSIKLHYVDQEGITYDPNSCPLVYKGFIHRYSHDDESVTLSLEDSTQKDLHKDVPVARLGDGNEILDKYKNKPIPMVYGSVDRSPLVIDNSSGSYTLRADSKTIESFENEHSDVFSRDSSSLYISADDVYYNIVEIVQRQFDYLDDFDDPVIVGTTPQFTEDETNSLMILNNTAFIKNSSIQSELIGKPKTILLNEVSDVTFEIVQNGNLFSENEVIGLTDNDYSTNIPVEHSDYRYNYQSSDEETGSGNWGGAGIRFDMTPTADFHASELQQFAFDSIILPATATSLLLNSNADITDAGLGDFIILGAEDADGVLETMRVDCYATGTSQESYDTSDPHVRLKQEFAGNEGNSYTIKTGGNWNYTGDGGVGESYLWVKTYLNMKEVDYFSWIDIKAPLSKMFYININGRFDTTGIYESIE